jgi:L-idonate 5-dehydrogenase
MRGVIIHAAKDLRIEEVETPPLGPGEVRVRIEAGGICGSDLHYYQDGGFGTVRVRQPIVPVHGRETPICAQAAIGTLSSWAART